VTSNLGIGMFNKAIAEFKLGLGKALGKAQSHSRWLDYLLLTSTNKRFRRVLLYGIEHQMSPTKK